MYRGARRTSAYSFELCTFLVWSHAVLGAREAFSGPRTVATMTQPGGRRRQAAGGSHCPGRDGGQGPGARGGHASPRSIAGEHVPGSVSSRGYELRRDVSLGGLQQRSGPLRGPRATARLRLSRGLAFSRGFVKRAACHVACSWPPFLSPLWTSRALCGRPLTPPRGQLLCLWPHCSPASFLNPHGPPGGRGGHAECRDAASGSLTAAGRHDPRHSPAIKSTVRPERRGLLVSRSM